MSIEVLTSALKSESANFVFSPFAFSVGVGMKFEGLSGESRQTFSNALGIKSHCINFEALYKKRLANSKQIKFANLIAVQKYENLSNSFIEVMKRNFEADFFNVDFRDDKTVDFLNNLIKDKTGGKIKDFYAQDAFDEATRLKLINALHLKTNWIGADDFYNGYENLNFHLESGKTIEVTKTIGGQIVRDRFKRFEELQLEILHLGLRSDNRDLGFIAVIPDEVVGIKHALDMLKHENVFEKVLKPEIHLPKVWAFFAFPKFETETSVDLKENLLRIYPHQSEDEDFIEDMKQKSTIGVGSCKLCG